VTNVETASLDTVQVDGLKIGYRELGEGAPVLLVHGWPTSSHLWRDVMPALAEGNRAIALDLPGYGESAPVDAEPSVPALRDAVERAMDAAGFETAHLVGNSLGGWIAAELAARGRARSVVALAPAGGWAIGDRSYERTLGLQAAMQELVKAAAPHAEAIVSSPEGRRRATRFLVEDDGRIPTELLVHLLRGAAACDAALPLIEHARRAGWSLEPELITCPVRVVWGTADRLLEWPAAAVRYRDEWLPHADWVELEGVGHCPQLEVPVETAELILGFSAS
jgi:pimeloyl-ACP methyl ester carboxylesterase